MPGRRVGYPRLLRFTSCQAENSESLGRAIARYVAQRLGVETEFVDDVPWRERERLLDEGYVHAGWICGLPYVLKADRLRPCVELLGAPIMSGARYGGRSVYFSDIVVRRDYPARSFGDLRGSRWGYNEPRSHSGYAIVRHRLAQLGEQRSYFASTVETGAHQATLRMILDEEIDASAIDSTVLETELRHRPELGRRLRVIESWGPSPAPPWVVTRCMPSGLRLRLRHALLGMHREPRGRSILREARLRRFGDVADTDYDPIRRIVRGSAHVVL